MEEISSDFRIEILYGGKAIFVKCQGYESEIFIPLIHDNRIFLRNAIVQRRCCKNSNEVSKTVIERQSTRRISIPRQLPLANSTPARFNESPSGMRTKSLEFASPDVVRRALVDNNNVTVSIPNLAPGMKIVPLHRVVSGNTPKKLARLDPMPRTYSLIGVSTSKNNTNILRNLSNVSTFNTPPRLSITNNSRTPNHSLLVPRRRTPGSATKWRKCITPIKTYIRRNQSTKSPRNLTKLTIQPLQSRKNGKLIPDFRHNPTKWPIGEGRVLVKPRKLVLDNKLTISPKSFKNQLKHTDDLNRVKFQLPKSKLQLKCSQLTAFDFLTNSSFYPRMAKHLNSLFRRGCLNKTASTILKYQKLTSAIPEI